MRLCSTFIRTKKQVQMLLTILAHVPGPAYKVDGLLLLYILYMENS